MPMVDISFSVLRYFLIIEQLHAICLFFSVQSMRMNRDVYQKYSHRHLLVLQHELAVYLTKYNVGWMWA